MYKRQYIGRARPIATPIGDETALPVIVDIRDNKGLPQQNLAIVLIALRDIIVYFQSIQIQITDSVQINMKRIVPMPVSVIYKFAERSYMVIAAQIGIYDRTVSLQRMSLQKAPALRIRIGICLKAIILRQIQLLFPRKISFLQQISQGPPESVILRRPIDVAMGHALIFLSAKPDIVTGKFRKIKCCRRPAKTHCTDFDMISAAFMTLRVYLYVTNLRILYPGRLWPDMLKVKIKICTAVSLRLVLRKFPPESVICLLYTSDAADER